MRKTPVAISALLFAGFILPSSGLADPTKEKQPIPANEGKPKQHAPLIIVINPQVDVFEKNGRIQLKVKDANLLLAQYFAKALKDKGHKAFVIRKDGNKLPHEQAVKKTMAYAPDLYFELSMERGQEMPDPLTNKPSIRLFNVWHEEKNARLTRDMNLGWLLSQAENRAQQAVGLTPLKTIIMGISIPGGRPVSKDAGCPGIEMQYLHLNRILKEKPEKLQQEYLKKLGEAMAAVIDQAARRSGKNK